MGNALSDASALFDAISSGDAETAVKALELHPELTHKRAGTKSRTVYHACASSGQLGVLRRLCEHVWRTVPDEFGKTHPKKLPEGRSHPTIYQAINSYDQTGNTPLILACRKGHAQVIEYLLSQGADPWIGDRLMGRAPLHHAARHNHPDCIEAIMTSPFVDHVGKVRVREHKLVDYPSNSGYTPLHYAATSRAAEAAAVLFRYGANPNAKTWDPGFDFIQMERASTPLHAAARFHNLGMAMVLLKHWHDNLKDLDVTDPRVVEDYNRVKPYQLGGVKEDKALYRVLDPATPIQEIVDPFGEGDKELAAPVGKAARMSPTAQDSDLSKPSTASDGGDKVPPAGWEDVLPSPSGGNKPRGGAADFVTVYRCPEFVADGGMVPVASAKLTTPATLRTSRSTGRSTALPGPTTTVAATGLGRSRSGAVMPQTPASSQPPPLQKASSLKAPPTAYPHLSGPGSESPEGQAAPRAWAHSPASPTGSTRVCGPQTGLSSSSPFSALPTTAPKLSPSTPSRAEGAQAEAAGPGRLSVTGDAGNGDPNGYSSPTGLTSSSLSSGGGQSRTISGGPQPTFTPGSPPEKPTGRSLTKTLSKKLTTLKGALGSVSSSSSNGEDEGAAAAAVRAAKVLGSSPTCTSPSGISISPPRPPKINAWGVTAPVPVRKGGSREGAVAAEEPCFTRDSHAEDSQRVEVTMYPHIRVNLERMKKGETSNDVEEEVQQASARALAASGSAKPCSVGPTEWRVNPAADTGASQLDTSTFSVSRRGLMPTNDLSDDESRVEHRAAKALSPQASRRRH